jgi:hypothetical protein
MSFARALSIGSLTVLGLLLVSPGTVAWLEILQNQDLIAAWLLAPLPGAWGLFWSFHPSKPEPT